MQTQITDITHVIQLAVAPVFLLTGVGTVIGVLTNRLARIIDRTRLLEDRLEAGPDPKAAAAVRQAAELRVLARRMRLVYVAIGFAVSCALCVGLLITLAFVDAFLSFDLAKVVGLLFVAAMLCFIVCLSVFLREIFLAVSSAGNDIRQRAS